MIENEFIKTQKENNCHSNYCWFTDCLACGYRNSRTKYIHNIFDEIFYSCTQNPIFRATWCNPKNLQGIVYEDNPYLSLRLKGDETKKQLRIMLSWNKIYTSLYYPCPHIGIETAVRIYDKNPPFEVDNPDIGFIRSLYIEFVYYPDSRELIAMPLSFHGSFKVLDDIKRSKTSPRLSDPAYLLPLLEKNNITKEDIIEAQKILLYDTVLPNWIESSNSKFGLSDLGDYVLVDRTFEEIDF